MHGRSPGANGLPRSYPLVGPAAPRPTALVWMPVCRLSLACTHWPSWIRAALSAENIGADPDRSHALLRFARRAFRRVDFLRGQADFDEPACGFSAVRKVGLAA